MLIEKAKQETDACVARIKAHVYHVLQADPDHDRGDASKRKIARSFAAILMREMLELKDAQIAALLPCDPEALVELMRLGGNIIRVSNAHRELVERIKRAVQADLEKIGMHMVLSVVDDTEEPYHPLGSKTSLDEIARAVSKITGAPLAGMYSADDKSTDAMHGRIIAMCIARVGNPTRTPGPLGQHFSRDALYVKFAWRRVSVSMKTMPNSLLSRRATSVCVQLKVDPKRLIISE